MKSIALTLALLSVLSVAAVANTPAPTDAAQADVTAAAAEEIPADEAQAPKAKD